jgi:hypothetical protein
VDGRKGHAALGGGCTCALHFIPLILLNLYQCQVVALVVNVIQDLGCKEVCIHSGCISLVQPLNIGYNKPFKTCICACWGEYIIDDMCMNGSISMPSRLDVSAWVA